MSEQDGIYYRVYQGESGGLAKVACMQWFDEHDYDQAKFFTGKIDDEEKAEEIARFINCAVILPDMASDAILKAFRLWEEARP